MGCCTETCYRTNWNTLSRAPFARHYRGHDVTDVEVFKARQKRGVTRSIRRELKRRNAIEPIIGHMKNDGLLYHNHLNGTEGDAINVIL